MCNHRVMGISLSVEEHPVGSGASDGVVLATRALTQLTPTHRATVWWRTSTSSTSAPRPTGCTAYRPGSHPYVHPDHRPRSPCDKSSARNPAWVASRTCAFLGRPAASGLSRSTETGRPEKRRNGSPDREPARTIARRVAQASGQLGSRASFHRKGLVRPVPEPRLLLGDSTSEPSSAWTIAFTSR